MALMLHVDFNGDDWVGFNRATDAANLWGSPTISIFRRQTIGAGGSSANGTAFDRYSTDRAKYGKDRINWTTGTSATALINIGYDGTTYDNPAKPAGTYTAVLWARRTTGINPPSVFQIGITDATTTNYGRSTAASLTGGVWTKFTVTVSVPSPDDLVVEFYRTLDTTSLGVEITGVMLVAGSSAPDWFNPGIVGDDLTPYWMDGKWTTGFVKPHQAVAPLGKADLTLKNADKRFSPEYASGPLYGLLLPNLLMQIGDPDVGIWWTGWTDEWMPEPGPSRTKRATLSATDARRFISGRMPPLPLYSISTGPSPALSVVVPDILEQFDIPNTTEGLPLANIPGTPAWPYYYAWTESLSTVAASHVFADNTPYNEDAVKVLGDIFGSAQGKLWFTREGWAMWRGAQGDTTPATYNNVGALWMESGYSISKIINHCEVIAHMRKHQISGGPYTVWELDSTITLTAGEVEEFRVFWTHSNEAKVLAGAGGTFAVTGTLAAGTFGTDVTAVLTETSGQSAILTLTNVTGVTRIVNTTVVTATERAVQLREISKEREDATSIAANGTLTERLNYDYVSLKPWAKRLARYRVTRFKDPIYEVPWFTIHADKNPTEAFRCYVGAPIYFSDAQTGHAKYYACIGEQHTVKAGVTDHRIRVYTESLYETSVFSTPTA